MVLNTEIGENELDMPFLSTDACDLLSTQFGAQNRTPVRALQQVLWELQRHWKCSMFPGVSVRAWIQ